MVKALKSDGRAPVNMDGSKRPKGVVQEAFEVYKAVLTYSAYWYNNKNSYAFQRFWPDAAVIPPSNQCLEK